MFYASANFMYRCVFVDFAMVKVFHFVNDYCQVQIQLSLLPIYKLSNLRVRENRITE